MDSTGWSRPCSGDYMAGRERNQQNRRCMNLNTLAQIRLFTHVRAKLPPCLILFGMRDRLLGGTYLCRAGKSLQRSRE